MFVAEYPQGSSVARHLHNSLMTLFTKRSTELVEDHLDIREIAHGTE